MLTMLPHIKADAYTVQACPSDLSVQFLILSRPGNLRYDGYTGDGVFLGEIGGRLSGVTDAGTSIHPATEEGLGQGVRLLESGGALLTVDFLGPDQSGLSIYSYTPESPWAVTNGQQVGDSFFWFEWQPAVDSPSTLVRLMRSASAKLTDPQVIQTVTVQSTILTTVEWRSARGPDFTTIAAGLWLEANNEIVTWERVVISLSGEVWSQRETAVEADNLDSVLRAGYPAGAVSITQTSGDVFPGNTDPLPAVIWGGDAEDNYVPWGSVGEVVAIAPDPASGLWVIRASPNLLEHYDNAGILLETVELEVGQAETVGLHVLADPIPWIE